MVKSLLCCFNSIKVQLEHNAYMNDFYSVLKFQFHKGAIRTFVPYDALLPFNVSIP